jgi:hypothetical protein
MTWIALATEDEVSECVGLQLAAEAGLEVGQRLRRGGNGYLKSGINKFCKMAQQQPVLLITDLDRLPCASSLINDWLGQRPRPAGLLFRVAVRETESWLLADHDAVRTLFGSRASRLPDTPDILLDPKDTFLNLARRYASRDIQSDLIVADGSVASQGLGYNARLVEWISASWKPERAAQRSPSLCKARLRLMEFANG